jgi:hypothetical protein
MPAVIAGLLAGIVLGLVSAALSFIRRKGEGGTSAAVNFFANLIVTGFLVTWPVVGWALPTATFFGVLPLVILDLLLAAVIAWIADGAAGGLSAASFVMTLALIASGIGWIAGVNGPHDAHAASHIVQVTLAKDDQLPASSTDHLVVVTPDQAATRASQAMSSGIAGTRNYATYTNPGPATLQRVDGAMWYVFQLEFDGAGNKQRLHGIVPGYIMISAEDPNAAPVERYDGQYTMVVSLAGGQGSEPMRYVRDHLPGASGYILQDPTLEIQDGTGVPYFTVTMLKPQLGTTFFAPVAVALVNAHTGQVTKLDLPGHGSPANQLSAHAPWVDRVYSQDMAEQIANWYGMWSQAGWAGLGNGNKSSRFQVSGTPVLTYTGDENPSWRMLLTSFNTETSVYRIVEMDSATGAITVYRPSQPMGIESTVASAMCNAQGTGAGQVKSNHLVPEHMSLHIIDGELVWLASYESSQASDNAPDQQAGDDADPCGNGEAPVANPTFTGVGFVPAYAATAANAVFGNTRQEALNNLFSELAGQGSANGSNPSAGAVEVTVAGTLCGKASDVSGGNQVYYLTLCGAGGKPDNSRVYMATSATGPAVVLSQPGDKVVLRVLKATASNSQQQVQGFSDAQHPVGNGSGPAPAPSGSASAAQSAYRSSAAARISSDDEHAAIGAAAAARG